MSWQRLRRVAIQLSIVALLFLLPATGAVPAEAQEGRPQQQGIQGPFIAEAAAAYDFTGSLLDLAAQAEDPRAEYTAPQPLKYTPNTQPKGSAPELAHWVDPVLQNAFVGGLIPGPLKNFAGISFNSGGSGWPPDTNGDVGPAHYIQAVNTSFAIFDKTSGSLITQMHFNTFFTGTNTPCDFLNSGDPVVVYDRLVGRWLISDFSLAGPYYECIAISKTDDPVNGGWYMYGVKISDSLMNDYPKVGVWEDGYYFSFNMFAKSTSGDFTWEGVQMWAFEKARMLAGQPIQAVSFALESDSGYESLLPGHALSAPPPGTPAFFATVAPPDRLFLWKFKPNWTVPALSSFSGPQEIQVADFASADSVEQRGTTTLLDSLSPRPMMQLIYRAVNGVEALWMTHSVTNRGTAGMRWYELRQPAGTAALHQQGTYQPDNHHRWMGSLAVDRDGNMALGYSIASSSLHPGIRYTGRLAGEVPGQQPQGEGVLIDGAGSQLSSKRWGDYSSMSVDPVDDCTYWYTNEYYAVSGANWQTRIGTFKFPSCGEAKGSLQGVVRNALTHQPVANVPVVAFSGNQQMTVLSSSTGSYNISLGSGTYQVAAGPLLPGYPASVITSTVELTAGSTTLLDILLTPVPNLVEYSQAVDDSQPGGNQNGFAEPGESNLQLQNTLQNNGAITATHITANLQSLTPGVVISQSQASYPPVQPGQTAVNLAPFTFSLDKTIACAQDLIFRKIITDSHTTYTETFSLPVGIPLNRLDLFKNDMEAGSAGWTTGGTNNSWALTTAAAHSPVHAWTDSPTGNYLNNSSSWLMSPVYDLHAMRDVQIKFWARFALEAGYDYVYLEYSTDGGATWVGSGSSLILLNGQQKAWQEYNVPAPVLDKQSSVRLRFHLVTDGGVTGDGIYIDDVAISYQPYLCPFGKSSVLILPLIFK